MFSHSKQSSRRQSKGDDKSKRKEQEKQSRRLADENIKATFENLIGVVKSIEGDVLDKRSVTACLESVYNWYTFDRNMQLDLPHEPGALSASKMWPQGAVVNTGNRRRSLYIENSPRKLGDADADALSTVTSSVMSSTGEAEGQGISRGKVMRSATFPGRNTGVTKVSSFHSQSIMEDVPFESPVSYNRGNYTHNAGYPPMPQGSYGQYEGTQGNEFPATNGAPRESYTMPVPVPQRVQETPDILYSVPRADGRRVPRMGVAPREGNGNRSSVKYTN